MTALDITTNVGTIDDLTSLARILLVGRPALWRALVSLQPRCHASGDVDHGVPVAALLGSVEWVILLTPHRAAT